MATKRGSYIETRNGRPTVMLDGEPVPQSVYCDYILRGNWEERNEEFVASGVRVFHLTVAHGDKAGGEDFFDNAFWTADGVYPVDDHVAAFSLDHQAESILKVRPDALFYIKFQLTPPIDWMREHPGDMQTDENGKTYREASFASARLRRDLTRYVRGLVDHCETRPWRDHIVGYLGLPYGEGIMPLNIAGKMFDCSAVNQRAFRQWVRTRYRSEARLRKAWGNPTLTFGRVRVPRDADWYARRQAGPVTLGGKPLDVASLPSNALVSSASLFHWVEERNAAPERDYCRFMREMFLGWARTIHAAAKDTARKHGRTRIVGLDIIKQHQIGWQILSTFDGIGDGQSFPSMFPLTGSIDMDELLDDDLLDAVWNPADYYARTLGFAYESEGLTDTMALRGKVAFVENDARTYVGEGIKDQGAFRDEREVEVGLIRNAALTLSRGVQSYQCNVGSSYFHDAAIQDTVARVRRMVERVERVPHVETRDAIAFIVDDESPLFEDFTSGYQTLALILQRIRGLSHCGVPYRILLLSDVRRRNLPRYHTWVFPNLFRVVPETVALLRRKVLRDGNVAVFGPSTGITDGKTLGVEGASGLLGVPMELFPRTTVRHVIVQDDGHPLSAPLPASLVYGDSMPYGPTMVPGDRAVENAGAVPLGHANLCWFIHRTGLFLKEFGRGGAGNGKPGGRGAGDYAVVWSAALPLPGNLLRECARYAGGNIWCEEDDVVYACDSFVALHSVKRGVREINLPRPCRVTDAVSGRRIGKRKTMTIRVGVRPPETRAFVLE